MVEEALAAGGSCGAASWSETAQKVLARGRDWELARRLLLSYELALTADRAWPADPRVHPLR